MARGDQVDEAEREARRQRFQSLLGVQREDPAVDTFNRRFEPFLDNPGLQEFLRNKNRDLEQEQLPVQPNEAANTPRGRITLAMLGKRGVVPGGGGGGGPGYFLAGNEGPLGFPGGAPSHSGPAGRGYTPAPAPAPAPSISAPANRDSQGIISYPTQVAPDRGRGPTIYEQNLLGPMERQLLVQERSAQQQQVPLPPQRPEELQLGRRSDDLREQQPVPLPPERPNFNPFFDPQGQPSIGFRGFTEDARGLHPSDRGFENTGPQDRTLAFPTPLPPPNPFERTQDVPDTKTEEELRDEQLQELGPSRSEQQLRDEQLQELGPSPGKDQSRYSGPQQAPQPYIPEPEITDDPNAPANQGPAPVPEPYEQNPEDINDDPSGGRGPGYAPPVPLPVPNPFERTQDIPDVPDTKTEEELRDEQLQELGPSPAPYFPDLNQTFSNFSPLGENKAGEIVFGPAPPAPEVQQEPGPRETQQEPGPRETQQELPPIETPQEQPPEVQAEQGKDIPNEPIEEAHSYFTPVPDVPNATKYDTDVESKGTLTDEDRGIVAPPPETPAPAPPNYDPNFDPSRGFDQETRNDPTEQDKTDAEVAAELQGPHGPSMAELQAAGYLTTQVPDLQSIDINAARDAAEAQSRQDQLESIGPAPAAPETTGQGGTLGGFLSPSGPDRGEVALEAAREAGKAAEQAGPNLAAPYTPDFEDVFSNYPNAVPEDFGPTAPGAQPYGPYGPTEAPPTGPVAPTVPDYGPYGPGGQNVSNPSDTTTGSRGGIAAAALAAAQDAANAFGPQEERDQEEKSQEQQDKEGLGPQGTPYTPDFNYSFGVFDPNSPFAPEEDLGPAGAPPSTPDYGPAGPGVPGPSGPTDIGMGVPDTAGPMGGLADQSSLGGLAALGGFNDTGFAPGDIGAATLASFAEAPGPTGFDDTGAAPSGFDDTGAAPGGFDGIGPSGFDDGASPGGFDAGAPGFDGFDGAPGDGASPGGFDSFDGAPGDGASPGGFDSFDGAPGDGSPGDGAPGDGSPGDGSPGGDFGDGDGDDGGDADGGDADGGDADGGDADGGDGGGGDGGGGDGGGGDGGGGDGGGGDGGGGDGSDD